MKHQNRLASETSPYLLQHAAQSRRLVPVGPGSARRAPQRTTPILLSIGYAACHWCHVMEREWFENDAIAAQMNESFVCIKVDREERPDLDDIYMAATVALSGSGGWPMTVFLTPEQAAVLRRHLLSAGRSLRASWLSAPCSRRHRRAVANDRATLLEQAAELAEHVAASARDAHHRAQSARRSRARRAQLRGSYRRALRRLRHGAQVPAERGRSSCCCGTTRRAGPMRSLLEMVTLRTLDGMKNGGIYDHLGGGFARYSTDERWLVPHFEKMLYDNAQLASVYLDAYQVTRDPQYARVARDTLDYVMREMQEPNGG